MNFLGPQVDVAVGMNEACSNPNQSWQGLTIKEILEKVDLSNIIMDEDKKKVSVVDSVLNLSFQSFCLILAGQVSTSNHAQWRHQSRKRILGTQVVEQTYPHACHR